jgi:hypothetical protein
MTIEDDQLERDIELQALSFVTTAPNLLVARTVPRRSSAASANQKK